MSLLRSLLDLTALPLQLGRRHRPRRVCSDPRILVIRRHRMGDMLYTLPLFHALRGRFPHAHLTVACDPPGASIALACEAVNDVIVLDPGGTRWAGVFKNAARLQDYDWVIAAKGGFDRRLAILTRLTNGSIRIGFEPESGDGTTYFTDPVSMPPDPHAEHQIETQLRLLQPLGVTPPVFDLDMLRLKLPEKSLSFAEQILTAQPFAPGVPFALINISCHRPVKFTTEDYEEVVRLLIKRTPLAVGIVSSAPDREAAQDLAKQFPADRAAAISTPESLDLAALLERAVFFVTPEGGAAHLSSAMRTPTLVLWSGHYGKWRPRGERQTLVEAGPDESRIPIDRVWQVLHSYLTLLPR